MHATNPRFPLPFFSRRLGTKMTSLALAACLAGTVPTAALAAEANPEATASAASAAAKPAEPAETTKAAVSKKEVVYAKLDATGAASGVYVMNVFSSASDESITDYGSYERVTNVTDEQPLSEGSSRTLAVSADEDFYYQGDLPAATQLPWVIALTYRLDGQAAAPESLGGASGHLVMTLEIRPVGTATEDFSDAYLLQVSGALAGDSCANVVADGATVAQDGSDAKVSYLVFPGKSVTYDIEADVTDFEFGGWTIAGVPLAIALDTSDVDMDASQLTELEDAVSSLDAGAAQVASGTASAQEGTALLASKGGELAAGSSEAQTAIAQLADGSSALASRVSGQLVPQVEALAAGSRTYYDALGSQAAAARAAAAQVDVVAAQSAYQQALGAYLAAYAACLRQGGDPSTDPAALTAFDVLQQALEALVTAQAAQTGYASAASALDGARDGDGTTSNGYADINNAIQGVVDPSSETSLYALSTGAESLAVGLDALDSRYALINQGVGSLAQGTEALSAKFADLQAGTQALATGAGTLASKTSGLDQKLVDSVREELAAYLDPGFEPRSFVSARNANVESVQFVFVTASIGKDADTADSDAEDGAGDAAQTQSSSGEETPWTRFLALFGL